MSNIEPNPVVEDLEKALSDAERAPVPGVVPTPSEAPWDPLAGVQQPTNDQVANAAQAVKDAGG